jgi:hypothetical protein
MLIQRRITVAKEGQTEKLLEHITGWFETRNHPWAQTRVSVYHPDSEDDSSSNRSYVIIEHEGKDMADIEERAQHWRKHVTEEDVKLWQELVEEVIIEHWTVSRSYEETS